MDTEESKERRKEGQRRHHDAGPPQGMIERRINIERRLFNLGMDCGWGLGQTPASGGGDGSPAVGY